MADLQKLASSLKSSFPSELKNSVLACNELTIDIASESVFAVCEKLKEEFHFEILIDLCGVDYSTYGQDEWFTNRASNTGFSRAAHSTSHSDIQKTAFEHRFAVVYHLLSLKNNQRLRVRAWVADNDFPCLQSVMDVWSSANWYEREAFDLFGIIFEGHPDLRRILTDYGFVGHPFRKDFPLIGHVEMRYDPEQKRVIYEPVSIEPRVLVPRVIRNDHRYADDTNSSNEESESNA
ncbi:NADH-ubiquinone oxidoreductase chain C [hydrothermal vent metagenome]|uniref:NADH-ubiquinone oxidoreductase chain C n=1 Tax=hydrothermal vent metagenome TaxID=652676 RepID=A0A3B0YPF2_9ZZZZ